jgi:hypothetical protein
LISFLAPRSDFHLLLRQRAELPLLDAFHSELLAHGVTGYNRRAPQAD